MIAMLLVVVVVIAVVMIAVVVMVVGVVLAVGVAVLVAILVRVAVVAVVGRQVFVHGYGLWHCDLVITSHPSRVQSQQIHSIMAFGGMGKG